MRYFNDPMQPVMTPRREVAVSTPVTAPTSYGQQITPTGVPKPPGLLTRIGNSIQDRLAPPPPPEMMSLLDPASIKAARRGAILDLGTTLLRGSGWSETPITLGQSLGAGLQNASQGYQERIGQLAQQGLARQNAAFLNEQRMAVADERSANAAAKSAELARVTGLMSKRLQLYQGLFAGWAGKTREEQQQVLFDGYRVALQNNDTETADALKGMISSGNVVAAAPKPANMRTVTTEEGVFAFDPATGQPGQRIGDRPRPAAGGGGSNSGQPSTYERGIITRDAKNIQTEVGKFRSFADLARSATSLNAKKDAELTGVDGIATLYNFIRSMDPNAVKEGELALAISSDPTLARFVQAAQGGQLLRGVKLSAPTIRKMLAAVTNNVNARATTTRRNIAGSVERIGNIDPSYITPSDTALGDYEVRTGGQRAPSAGAQDATRGRLFSNPAPSESGRGVPLVAPPPGFKPFVRRTP